MLKDYVVIDLEMTGLNAKTGRIIEVGAMRVRDGVPQEVYEALINPGMELSQEVAELTGLTNEMLAQGRAADEVIPEFFAFLGEDILVGQNISFDYSFLKQWAVNHKMEFSKYAVDTLKLARRFLPPEEKKNLEALCCYFQISQTKAHRALEDVKVTAQVFEKEKTLFYETSPQDFEPRLLNYHTKRQTPATAHQRENLMRLISYHHLTDVTIPNELTRSDASRLIDQLISNYGKIVEKR